jgi:oxygen-independent coproporphyrinogen III oxidase
MSRFPALTDELVRRLDVAGPRYTSYPTAPEWSETFDARAYAEALADGGRSGEPLSVYVHIPFCREMCTYCGCNVVITKDPGMADRYLDLLGLELTLVAARLGSRRRVARLHLGGGTPTFLDVRQLSRLFETLTADLQLEPDAEIAVEVDPMVTTPDQLERLASFGANRLSMGVQDLDPDVQAAVHRVQPLEVTRSIQDEARKLGFRSINTDLIYGLPRQTHASWRRTMAAMAALRPDRMSIFSFAYVPDAKPHQRRLAVADMLTGRAKLELLGIAHEVLDERGYRAIGIDHFAVPDDELARALDDGTLARDFQGYTTRRATDTIALGVSGISFVGGAYAQNEKSMTLYRKALFDGRLPTERGHRLDDEDRARRDVIQDLMCRMEAEIPVAFDDELAALAPHEEDGLIVRDGRRVTLTPLGRLFARNVAMVFDAYLRRRRDRPFSRTV